VTRGIGVLVALVACTSALQTATPQFDGGRAYEDLRQLVAIGPRPSGSPAIQQTREYIKKQVTAAGLEVVEQHFDASTPVGPIHMVNLRATLPGRAQDRGRIVIGGHYDTKLVREFEFVGASDGGSSAAFLLELARALKGRTNPLPIELLFLDGEEAVVEWRGTDHTYGSRHYVQDAKGAGAVRDIRAFILVDMIGDRDLTIRREQNSTRWLTDAIWDAAATLKRTEFMEETTPILDDHMEFLAAGIPSVDIIDLEYSAWHQPEDRLDRVAAGSLQAVGDVLIAALPAIESRLK
jgi:glutaminyl-peptide cyclotransferase